MQVSPGSVAQLDPAAVCWVTGVATVPPLSCFNGLLGGVLAPTSGQISLLEQPLAELTATKRPVGEIATCGLPTRSWASRSSPVTPSQRREVESLD